MTLSDRIKIEEELNKESSAKLIAHLINKDPTTVSKEVKNRRIETKANYYGSSKEYMDELPLCDRQKRFPHVCNGCPVGVRRNCRKLKFYYRAEDAHKEYVYDLSDSRIGYDITVEELNLLDNLISPLIRKGQSLYHIKASNQEEIGLSVRSLYRYVDDGLFEVANIDLPKKVVYKPRKKKKVSRLPPEAKKDIMFSDFIEFVSHNDVKEIVQVDIVEGKKTDSKCLLTLYFTSTKLMLIRLLPRKSAKLVVAVFDRLELNLKSFDAFRKLFQVVLFDNGPEFSNITGMKRSVYQNIDEDRMNIFFCNPGKPYQKGGLEKNHVHIRSILPKRRSFKNLDSKKVHLIESHINSYLRKSLKGKSPYQAFRLKYGDEICQLLKLIEINSNDIILKPSLIK